MVAATKLLSTTSEPGQTTSTSSACRVAEALRKNAHHGLTYVTCEIREGMAILHGKVPRYYLKQMAQEIAKNSEGVDSVVNRIQVETEPLDPTRSR